MTLEQAHRHVEYGQGLALAMKSSTVTQVFARASFDVKTRKLKVAVSAERINCAQRLKLRDVVFGVRHLANMPPLADLVSAQHGINTSEIEVVSYPKPCKARAAKTEGKTKTVYKVVSYRHHRAEKVGDGC